VRVLLDTNILVSAVLFGGLPRRLLQRALRGEFDVVTSPALMAEFEEVLGRFDFDASVAAAARSEYEQLNTLGSADLVVTGDRDLLVLGEYEGCRVATAREFEAIVDAPTD
jgi:predicted nucleic acid-binding protein